MSAIFETKVLDFLKPTKSSEIQKQLNKLGSKGFQVISSTLMEIDQELVERVLLSRPKEPLPGPNPRPKESVPSSETDFDGWDGDL